MKETGKLQNKKNPKRLLFYTKLLLGIVLLIGLIIWDNNGARLVKILRSINLEYILGLLVVGFALIWISCVKWNLFLKEQGYIISISRLHGLYLIGRFFSNFIPSMVGGDLTRSYLLGKQINSQYKSFASIFLERFTGLVALIILAVTFSILNPKILSEPKIGIAILTISIVFALSIFLLLNKVLLDYIASKLSFSPLFKKVLEKVKNLQNDILYFKGKYRLLFMAMVLSFCFHITTSLNVYLCCLAINFYPSFLDIAVITPIILLLNIIPVSPNNIGWWEWTFSYMLIEAGAGSAEGLAVALVLRGMTFLFSLVGGMIFLFDKTVIEEKKKNLKQV